VRPKAYTILVRVIQTWIVLEEERGQKYSPSLYHPQKDAK
jgi:hypothetical protein